MRERLAMLNAKGITEEKNIEMSIGFSNMVVTGDFDKKPDWSD